MRLAVRCLPASQCRGGELVLGQGGATILIAQAACRFRLAGTQGQGTLLASVLPCVPSSA